MNATFRVDCYCATFGIGAVGSLDMLTCNAKQTVVRVNVATTSKFSLNFRSSEVAKQLNARQVALHASQSLEY